MNKFDNINLIGLVGEAGSGKDTAADYMIEEGWVKFAFAQALKDMCIDYLGLSHDDAYTQEGKLKYNDFWGMTNREILQKVGTDAFRNGFHKDTWVKIAELKISNMLKSGKKVIITDCRFDNEAEMVERLGGIVMNIQRKNYQSNLTSSEKGHISEQGINEKYISRIILNDREKIALKRMMKDCLASFEKAHHMAADSLEKLVHAEKINQDIAEQFLFNIKKFCNCSFNQILSRNDNMNIRVEWTELKQNVGILITNGLENKIQFEMLPHNNINLGQYNHHKLEFTFDDVNGWKSINQLINNN